ncbi:MAG: hypothetical protein HY978_02435 [Candidatus Liptonbacteria bacterium]|nr:hypothetical protein [Candidatus Liptonbacteria bacterium]
MPIVSARTACLLQAATERGYVFEVLESRFGDVRYIRMLAKNGRRRSFVFESLPLAEFTSHYPPSRVDDKLWVKRELEKAGWPAARGRSFWFFQARAALRYGSELGWPLVVKPRGGSFSRHVTTNICTPDALQRAISHAVAYAPEFIVEQYLGGLTVHRATVVDNSFVACAKREIPSVQGDGRRTISELVAAKNEDPFRGPPEDETYVLFRITIDAVSHAVLLEQGYAWDSVPSAGVRVYLQRDPFVRLGADVIEVTDQMHPDNRELFLGVAKHFDLRLVGLDFLTEDISRSWREQHCAILELNSLPCIEIHHQPSGGKPQDVAGALLNMMDKYYG